MMDLFHHAFQRVQGQSRSHEINALTRNMQRHEEEL